MRRITTFPKRSDSDKQLESIGMDYHPNYWQEGTVYIFTEDEIDLIESASQELHDLSIEMVSSIVSSGDYPEYFKLTDTAKQLIETSWKNNEPSVYGRFDLAYNSGQVKMLEYNGDTPVMLLESSVAQWNYLEQVDIPFQLKVQYNLIDETLIETWKRLFPENTTIHFSSAGGFRHEDFGNLVYMMDTAYRAGMNVNEIQMQDIGLNNGQFVDLNDNAIKHIFKLYPWEWMVDEQFGCNISGSNTKWLEPAWKMLLSNKAMLVKLYEMFPNHPNLLEAYSVKPSGGEWAKKAIHGREGSNIYKVGDEVEQLAKGSCLVPEYEQWGYIYQRWNQLAKFDNMYPIIGSWIIGNKACGMAVREDTNVVTGLDSYFVPHLYIPRGLENKFIKLI